MIALVRNRRVSSCATIGTCSRRRRRKARVTVTTTTRHPRGFSVSERPLHLLSIRLEVGEVSPMFGREVALALALWKNISSSSRTMTLPAFKRPMKS